MPFKALSFLSEEYYTICLITLDKQKMQFSYYGNGTIHPQEQT